MTAANRRGVALIARLRGEFRVLRGGFANQPSLPDVVGKAGQHGIVRLCREQCGKFV